MIYKIKEDDRGYLYGDAVFETMLMKEGLILFFKDHMKRLSLSAKALGMNIKKEEVEEAIKKEIKRRKKREGVIRVSVSRGVGGFYRFKKTTPVVTIREWEKEKESIKVITSSIRRGVEALDPQVKSSNFLPNILSYIEAREKGADDALFLNSKGVVQELTTSNIFIVKDGILLTPPPFVGVLAGITRGVVINIAKEEGILVKEIPFTRYYLYICDEAFCTNSVRGVLPIEEIDGRRIPAPGPITKRLHSLYWELAHKRGEKLF